MLCTAEEAPRKGGSFLTSGVLADSAAALGFRCRDGSAAQQLYSFACYLPVPRLSFVTWLNVSIMHADG